MLDLSTLDDDDPAWDALRREGIPLACIGCDAPMHPVALPRWHDGMLLWETRFFRHNPGHGHAATCILGGETPEHEDLKRRLAIAARRAGWTATLEVTLGGECRADVLATRNGRTWALEAQLARIQSRTAERRTELYEKYAGNVTWAAEKRPEWSRWVPAIGLSPDDHTQVIDGLLLDRPDGYMAAPPTPLDEVVSGILVGDLYYVFDGEGYYHDRRPVDPRTARRLQPPSDRPVVDPSSNPTRLCTRTPEPDRPVIPEPALDLLGDGALDVVREVRDVPWTRPTTPTTPAGGDDLRFPCPRCGALTEHRFYGPCDSCRADLRAKYR